MLYIELIEKICSLISKQDLDADNDIHINGKIKIALINKSWQKGFFNSIYHHYPTCSISRENFIELQAKNHRDKFFISTSLFSQLVRTNDSFIQNLLIYSDKLLLSDKKSSIVLEGLLKLSKLKDLCLKTLNVKNSIISKFIINLLGNSISTIRDLEITDDIIPLLLPELELNWLSITSKNPINEMPNITSKAIKLLFKSDVPFPFELLKSINSETIKMETPKFLDFEKRDIEKSDKPLNDSIKQLYLKTHSSICSPDIADKLIIFLDLFPSLFRLNISIENELDDSKKSFDEFFNLLEERISLYINAIRQLADECSVDVNIGFRYFGECSGANVIKQNFIDYEIFDENNEEFYLLNWDLDYLESGYPKNGYQIFTRLFRKEITCFENKKLTINCLTVCYLHET